MQRVLRKDLLPSLTEVERLCELFCRLLVGASLFLPIVVVGSYGFPALTAKVFFFQRIVLVMIAVYIVLLCLNWERYKPRLHILSFATLLWGVSLVLSTFAGVDWYQSMWSTYIRLTGVFLIWHYIAYYVIISSVVKKWKDWTLFFRMYVGVGMVVVLLALLYEVGEIGKLFDIGSLRVVSTMGNPTFFGAFSMILVFASLLLFSQEKKMHWIGFSLMGIIFAVFGVLASGTRGALLGLACGIAVAGAIYMYDWIREHRPKKEVFSAIGVLLIPIMLLAFVIGISSLQHSIEEAPAVGRFTNEQATTNLHTRFLAWEAGIKAWTEYPLLGWGPNNFTYAFNAYYPSEILQYGLSETGFDNAHNMVVEVLTTQGIVGLVLYGGIFFGIGFVLWRSYKKKIISIHVFSITLGLFAAHFVSNFFLFETPMSYFYFFFFLAFVSSQKGGSSKEHQVQSSVRKKRVAIISGTVVIAVGLLFAYSVPIEAEKNVTSAHGLLNKDVAEAIVKYEGAKSIFSPYFQSSRFPFLNDAIARLSIMEEGEEKTRLAILLREELIDYRMRHPLDLNPKLMRANLNIVEYSSSGNKELLAEAEELLQEGLSLSPRRQNFLYELAMVKILQGRVDEGLQVLQGANSSDEGVQKGWNIIFCQNKNRSGLQDVRTALRNMRYEKEFSPQEENIVTNIVNPVCK